MSSQHVLSLGNVVILEHLNLNIPEGAQHIANAFFFDGLGLTRDPFSFFDTSIIWVNIGYQQIHLPPQPQGAQKFRGSIGIVMPPELFSGLAARLEKVKPLLKDTKFDFKVLNEQPDLLLGSKQPVKTIEVTEPFGNRFRIHENTEELNFRGGLGIIYVEVHVPKGSSSDIASIYETHFGTLPSTPINSDQSNPELHGCRVDVGPRQQFILREVEQMEEYDGHHVCFYASNLQKTWNFLNERGLLFNNYRFSDRCGTFEEAVRFAQLRFKDFRLPSGKIFELEHEIRSIFHPCFMRPLVNRSGKNGIFCNQ